VYVSSQHLVFSLGPGTTAGSQLALSSLLSLPLESQSGVFTFIFPNGEGLVGFLLRYYPAGWVQELLTDTREPTEVEYPVLSIPSPGKRTGLNGPIDTISQKGPQM